MDTILYLYPARKIWTPETPEHKPRPLWGKLKKFLPGLWKTQEPKQPVSVTRTEYRFRDYRLVKAAVAGCEDSTDGNRLLEQLQELTEDPDHTYVVCREPLSFYYGREFREYRQQNWVEHLLRYGEDAKGYPLWPDMIVLGRNPFLPYVMLRYVTALRGVKWYLTDREYREEEDELAWELEAEYGLIPEIRLLPAAEDYGRLSLQSMDPCLVLDFSDSPRVYGGKLAAGSIWLDFPASEEKERRLTAGCPQIRYFSMKKEWKDPRKALEYLDTISKNGYNNSVD